MYRHFRETTRPAIYNRTSSWTGSGYGNLPTTLFLTGLLDAVPAALAPLSPLPLRQVYLACTSP